MSEWSKETVLKTVEPLFGSVGSNPTLSALRLTRSRRERCESGRIGLPAKELYPWGTVGSNPTLSEHD